jgi:hypothetical protein
MIIVNQDRDMIVNFDNIVNVYIKHSPNEKPDIRVNTLQDLELCLGSYTTEERAGQILDDIVYEYKKYSLDNKGSIKIDSKVYKMPLE